MSSTAQLLWAAARPVLDRDAIRAALEAGADVQAAARAAVGQQVGPLLHRALDAVDVAMPSALVHDASRCRAQSRMVLPMTGDLVLRPLARGGIEAVVIKGAALAPRYPDAALRPMGDVDVLAPPKQFKAALAVLQNEGWQMLPQGRAEHETTLRHPDMPGLRVDLHQGWTTWHSKSNRLDMDALWASRVATTLYDAPAFVLPPDEELVMLAAHASKPFHTFDRLIWSVDLAVVAQHDAIDWDRVRHLADKSDCRVALAVALTQARRLGLDAPASLTALPSRRHAALAAVLAADWPLTSRDPLVRDRLRYALVDNWRYAARVAFGEALSWGPAEAPRRTLRVLKRGAHRLLQRVA